MLEIIRQLITHSDDTPFEKFFDEYVMNVQDKNIIEEVHQNIRLNQCTLLDIERLAQEDQERLINDGKL